MVDVVAVGEPLVELAAQERGPLEEVTRFRRGWGGDTFNCVLAVARMGGAPGYVTRVGDDPFGEAFVRLCERERVDASRVVRDGDGYTGLYVIALDEAGRHGFTYFRRGSAASRLAPDDVDEPYVASARVLHTSGITQAISDSAAAAADRAVDVARHHGVLVSYDANLRPALRPVAFFRRAFEATVPRADVVFVSGEDLDHLYGDDDPERGVRRILDLGARVVVLKQGDEGCVVATGEELRRCPPWPVELVDASGGGDAFAGAFLAEWALRGASLEAAGRVANAVGALAVRGLGAALPIPTRDELETFIQRS